MERVIALLYVLGDLTRELIEDRLELVLEEVPLFRSLTEATLVREERRPWFIIQYVAEVTESLVLYHHELEPSEP